MGSGTSSDDTIRRQFIQRSLATATSGSTSSSFDPLDPESIAAQQRAARQMREGLNSSFGTSTRGTDSAKGTGLQGPKDDPIIGTPTVATQPGSYAVAEKQQADVSQKNYVKNNQEKGKNRGPRTETF